MGLNGTLLLVCHALMGAGFFACLILFLTIKQDLFRMERRLDAKRETLRAGLSASLDEAQCETDRGIAVKLDILTTRVGNLEYRTQQPPALARPPIADPVKGTSRQKVIQMAHQGRESESIATALRLPRNEVELLLKVHRAVAQVRQR